MFVVRRSVNLRYLVRPITIKRLGNDDEFVNNDVLQVGYRAKAKPYSGDIELQMDPAFKYAWLDHLETQYRGFSHHHTTYYGYHREEEEQYEAFKPDKWYFAKKNE